MHVFAQDIAVVISSKCTVDSLSEQEVKRIFLAKTYRINGKKVKVVELKNAVYKSRFYKNVVNKSMDELRSYWVNLVFTGRAKPPTQLLSVEKLVSKINENSLVITYLSADQVTKDMKVLYTLKDK